MEKMQDLQGAVLKELPITGMRRIANLIEFDGPVLSHYKDKFEDNYLYYWVDFDSTCNRWAFWRVTNTQLFDYLTKKVNLLEIFPKENDWLYFVDIGFVVSPPENIILIEASLVPEEYKPSNESYYYPEMPDEYNTPIDNPILQPL